MKKIFCLFLIIIASSCKDTNELEINDDYSDIPVIYSILNPGSGEDADGGNFSAWSTPSLNLNFDNDTDPDENINHFVRVQKAFLGSESAYSYTGISDSIYYNPDEIEVSMQLVHSETGEVGDSIILDLIYSAELADVYDILKEEGMFSTDDYYLYKIPTSNDDLCGGNCSDIYKNYRINVRRFQNGEVTQHAFSETDIVEPITMYQPRYRPPGTSQLPATINISSFAYYVKVNPSKNAKLYEVFLRFNYLEQTKQGYLDDIAQNVDFPTNDIVEKYIDFQLGSELASNAQYLGGGISTIDFIVSPSSFFQHLEAQISEQDISNPELYRYPLNTVTMDGGWGNSSGTYHRCFDVHVTAVNTELYTYLNASQTVFGLNQDSPGYNNIENGLGHFSSRSILNLKNLFVTNVTIDSLSFGQNTKKLNFACYDLTTAQYQFGFNCQEN